MPLMVRWDDGLVSSAKYNPGQREMLRNPQDVFRGVPGSSADYRDAAARISNVENDTIGKDALCDLHDLTYQENYVPASLQHGQELAR